MSLIVIAGLGAVPAIVTAFGAMLARHAARYPSG